MVSYPIAAALASGLFNAVIVSTEDGEIAASALSAGAEVLKRSKELAEDEATVVEVCLQVLETLKKEKCLPTYFCCIYPTAVFISVEDLVKSFNRLKEGPGANFVMGVSEYNLQALQALFEKDGYLVPMWPEYVGIQSQSQPPLVASNGTLYWARASAFLQQSSFYGEKLRGYTIPKIRAVDINTPEDYSIAQILAPFILMADNG